MFFEPWWGDIQSQTARNCTGLKLTAGELHWTVEYQECDNCSPRAEIASWQLLFHCYLFIQWSRVWDWAAAAHFWLEPPSNSWWSSGWGSGLDSHCACCGSGGDYNKKAIRYHTFQEVKPIACMFTTSLLPTCPCPLVECLIWIACDGVFGKYIIIVPRMQLSYLFSNCCLICHVALPLSIQRHSLTLKASVANERSGKLLDFSCQPWAKAVAISLTQTHKLPEFVCK